MKLDQYLQEAGKTPTEFAAEIGVPASTITRVLNGERSPGLGLLRKIDAGTGGVVRAEDFYDLVEEAPSEVVNGN